MIEENNNWLKVDEYIDFKDRTGEWQVGLVLAIQQKLVKIRLEGWPSKHDQLCKMSDPKIKPFRSVIRGYTGTQKTQAVRQHWSFTTQDHQHRFKEFKQFVQSLSLRTSEQINQFLRGKHYFYIDFLWTCIYTSKTEIQMVYKYFKAHLDFLKEFLQGFTKQNVQQQFSNKENPEHAKSAVFEGYHEYCDSVYVIMGKQLRLSKFLKANHQYIRQAMSESASISHGGYFVQYVKAHGIVQNFLKATLNLATIQSTTQIPLPFIGALIRLYKAFQHAYDRECKKTVLISLFKFAKIQFSRIREYTLKNQEKAFDRILQFFCKQFTNFPQQKQSCFLWVEHAKLDFYFGLIMTDSIEKRLKGIKKIREFFESILKSAYTGIKTDIAMFRQWIQQKRILQMIFQHNQHTEAIKKGCQLASILYDRETISGQQMLDVWNSCKSKHEAVRKIIFQLWISMVPVIKQSDIEVFSSVVLVSICQFDYEKRFLFEFTAKFVKRWQSMAAAKDLLDHCYKQAVKNQALVKFFATILQHSNIQVHQTVSQYMKMCLENIRQMNAPIIHCHLFYLILQQFYDADLDLPQDTIKTLTEFIQKSIGQSSQQKMVKVAIRTINQALGFKSITLENQQFVKLWNIFSSLGEEKQQIKQPFYEWIVNTSHEGMFHIINKSINQIFDKSMRVFIFREILCNSRMLDYINMSPSEFHLFKEFFLYINCQLYRIQKSSPLIHGKTIYEIRDMEIQGTNQLWQIFLNCRNQATIRNVTTFIKTIYLNVSSKMIEPLRKSRVDSLLQKIQRYFKDGLNKNNTRLIKNSLILLSKAVNEFKGQFQPMPGVDYHHPDKVTITLIEQCKIVGKLQFGLWQSISKLYDQVAKTIKISRDAFKLMIRDKQIHKQLNSFPYCSINPKNDYIRISRDPKPVKALIYTYLKQNLQADLVNLLSNPQVSQQAYTILDQIPITLQDKTFMDKVMQKNINLSEQTIYFNTYFLKIFKNLFCSDQNQSLQPFNKFFREVPLQVTSALSIPFTMIFLETIVRVYSKKQRQMHQQQASVILKSMFSQVKFINAQQHSNNGKYYRLFNQYFKALEILLPEINIIQYIVNQNAFCQFLELVFIQHKLDYLKSITKNNFQKLLQKISFTQQQETKIVDVLIRKIYPIIKNNTENSQRHYLFFIVFYSFLEELSQSAISQIIKEQNSLLQSAKTIIYSQKAETDYQTNAFLQGHLNILNVLYQKLPEVIDIKMANYILYQCLFYEKGKSESNKMKCKSEQSIKSALSIIITCCKQNQEFHFQCVKFLASLHQISFWRDSHKWKVNIKEEKKSVTGYVGLQNPGCICYLNSFVQQLFMVQSFRQQIINQKLERIQHKNYQLLDSLKLLFLRLKYSNQKFLDPLFFAKTLKSSTNVPIVNIYEQMDIDQFRIILFDRLQEYLPNDKNFVQELFGGVFANQVISKQCRHRSQRDQAFLSISLDVKNSLYESLHSLVKGQVLEGQNAYHCQQCGKKVKAVKRLSIKKLPQHLIVSLKRFEFNYEIDMKIKINDYCEFPNELDLTQYSYQKMNDDQNAQELDQDKYQKDSQTKDESGYLKKLKDVPENYFKYKLKGFVVHTGYADSGHYISYVEDKHEKWYQFNDEKVTEFNPSKIGEQAFGGKDGDGIKIKNAYLLIYERVKIQTGMDVESSNSLTMSLNNFQPKTKQLIEQILDQNRILQKQHVLFTQQYGFFISELIRLNRLNTISPLLQEIRHHLFITYFLNIKIRSHTQKNGLKSILRFGFLTIEILCKNQQLALQYLQHFSNEKILSEYFFYNHQCQKSRIIAETIVKVCQHYLLINNGQPSQSTPEIVQNGQQDSENKINKQQPSAQMITFKDMLKIFVDAIIRFIVKYQININFLCYILRLLSNIDQQIKNYLANIDILNIIFDNLISNSSNEQKLAKIDVLDCQIIVDFPFGKPSQDGLQAISKSMQKQSWHLLYQVYKYMKKIGKNEEISKFDIKIGAVPIQKLMSVMTESSQSKSIVACTTFLTQFCKSSPENLNYITKVIQTALKDLQSSKFRHFLLLLQKIILIKDQSQQYRIKKMIGLLKIGMSINDKYFNQSDIITQWVIKICENSKFFTSCLAMTRLLDDLIRNANSQKTPSAQSLKKHRNPHCQRLNLRLHGIMVSSEAADYQRSAEYKIRRLDQIKKGMFNPKTSFKQYQIVQLFSEGANIEYYFEMEWQKAKVTQSQLGYISFQLLQINDDQYKKHSAWDFEDFIRFIEPQEMEAQ